MTIEDDLRATMRAHDPLAPRSQDFTPPTVRRTNVLAPIAAAATVLLLVAGSLALWRHSTTHHQRSVAAVSCPGLYAHHPKGDGTASSLVPDRTPASVTVCAYLAPRRPQTRIGPTPTGTSLTGTRAVVGADLSAVRDTLALAPRQTTPAACDFYLATTDGDNYLIALTYADGTVVWVTAPGNHCTGSGSGRFTSSTNLLQWVSPAYRSGRWPAVRASGRLGDDTRMVPDHPTALHIATQHSYLTKQAPGKKISSDFSALVTALNAAPVTTSNRCGNKTGLSDEIYVLTFSYASGPDEEVTVEGGDCLPNVYNGNRNAANAAVVWPIVQHLLAGS